MTHEKLGLIILRYGLATVFLWFGFSQLFDGINWVAWVPEWAVSVLHVPPAFIVLGNGLFEVIAGAFLVLNIGTRWVALALALHLLVITIEIGATAIGIRDLGLTAATLALALLGERPEPDPAP